MQITEAAICHCERIREWRPYREKSQALAPEWDLTPEARPDRETPTSCVFWGCSSRTIFWGTKTHQIVHFFRYS